MPIGKRQQSNAMLYTVITFVGLFLVATTIAVIYYLQFEDQRKKTEESREQKEELASRSQWEKRGSIVGSRQKKETYLGKMVDYLDEMVYLIIGGLPEETSAEVKVETADRKVKDILAQLAPQYLDPESIDPNTTGLIQIMEKLKTGLDYITNAHMVLAEQFQELQNRFDDAMATSFEKEQTLLAEKEKYQQQVNEIQKSYDDLKALMEQTSQQRVQTLMAQLDEEKTNSKQLYQELLKTQAEFRMAENRMKRAQQELMEIKPLPDAEVAAFKPDGKVMLIDSQAKTVHLNIGSDDRVYPGLTFSVYDKSLPIPKNGRGKAEVEVFNVAKTFSSARITNFEKRNPIILGDIIANLIWDSDKANVFVIAGDFDIDNDGNIDYDAADKIKVLIEKWGGKVADTVSIDTDFLVLGSAPQVRKKPTFEEMEIYPSAMEKYEASLEQLAYYKKVLSRAETLSIPVFNYERFLYFIGYKTQSARPGAF